MAQKYGFFNSVNHDRVYDAADVAKFLSKYFTNGIFNNGLAVSSNDNMTVSVATGSANINGYSYENTETLTLDIDDADSELNRIDSVIIRLDLTNRQITTQILQGQYASTPSQPSITRSGNTYDLRLANILISSGATRITTEDITDTRFGSDCGNVVQAVQSLDTNDIFLQYETWFNNWFENLEDQLDENQAGHLQNEINDINSDIDDVKATLNKNKPAGVISIYAGSTAPEGWLICDGSAVSRTTYSSLFTAIGTTYGAGDESTTFNLPNLKGKIPVGYNSSDSDFDALGKTGGEKTHTLGITELPKKIIYDEVKSSGEYALLQTGGNKGYVVNSGGQPHNNMQPFIVMNYIISY